MKKIIASLLFLVICGVSYAANADNTISGTVYRPAGASTAETIELIIGAQRASESIPFFSDFITIAAGSAFSPYSITVPTEASTQWTIEYRCFDSPPDTICDGIVIEGYYADVGTTAIQNNATQLQGGSSYANKNLTLLTGNLINGVVNRPPGASLDEPISISVAISDSNSAVYLSDRLTINSGASSAEYETTVPDSTDFNWQVSYHCDAIDTPVGCLGYLSAGYYSTSGTVEIFESTQLVGGINYENIDLTLIEGDAISGKISRPDGVDNSIVIAVAVRVENADGLRAEYDFVRIFAGLQSADFSITVPKDDTEQWRIQYSCNHFSTPLACSKIVDTGYYTNTGTTLDASEATLLPGNQNHENKDFSLLEYIDDTLCFPIKAKNNNIAIICL